MIANLDGTKLEPIGIALMDSPWEGRGQTSNTHQVAVQPSAADSSTALVAGELIYGYTVHLTCKY